MATSPAPSVQSMEDRGIAVAKLSTILLSQVRTGDPVEVAALEKAASVVGFFYLDMRHDPVGQQMIGNLDKLFGLAEQYFNQVEAVKVNDRRFDIKPCQDLGWKKFPGGESFEISRDEVALNSSSILCLPPLFKGEWEKITDFSDGCDKACMTLLNSLSPESEEYHRHDQESDTGLKMTLAPSLAKVSEVRDSLHTDSGTITLLFCEQWGLHAFLRDAGIWAFIPPQEGCAVINVGNSLQRISGSKFHSPEHRVTQPFNGAQNRYYLSYFLRPENSAVARWERDP